MESWAIFKHAVRMVFGNFGDAIKVTGVLYGITIAAQLLLVGTLFHDQASMQTAMISGAVPWGGLALYFGITLISFTWIAISWHRYVLLNETPRFAPVFRGWEMLAYLRKALILVLVLCPFVALSGIVAAVLITVLNAIYGFQGFMGGMFTVAVILGSLSGVVPMLLVSYRLTPLFPAAALGAPMKMREAWAKTKGKNGMLLMLVLISVLAMFVAAIPTFVFDPTTIVAQVYGFILSWLHLVIGASIVTTLYGVYVEGRALDLA